MKLRLHNNDSTDHVDFEAETIEDIRKQAKDRVALSGWNNGWSEILKNN